MATKTPYIEELKATLNATKSIKDMLEKRIELGMNKINDLQDEYEQNELKILLVKTRHEIETLQRILHEKETYFEKFYKQHEEDAKEMNKNWSSVMAQAVAMKNTNEVMKFLIEKTKWDLVESNEEYKIAVYKRIKKTLNEK